MREQQSQIGDIGIVPGGDIFRTLLFVGFAVAIFYALCGPFTPACMPPYYEKVTSIFLVLGIGLAFFSAVFAHFVQISNPADLKKRHKILYPKIMLEIGVLVVFGVICFWVVALGGVLSSPFGSLVVVSPIFFVIEYLRWRDVRKYMKMVSDISATESDSYHQGEDRQLKKIERRLIKAINALNLCVVGFILVTVTFGEYFVQRYNLHLQYNQEAIIQLIGTPWKLNLSYLVYYFSVLATFFNVLPPKYTAAITKKLFL